jgi:hypothetical protein
MPDTILTNTCVCGRTFFDLGGFTRHEKSCRKGKKRLSTALARAKEVYQVKKARLSLSRHIRVSANEDQQDGSEDVGEANEKAVQQAWYH